MDHVLALDALPLAAILCVVVAIALAGLVHGTLGLGFPLIATPLVALVTDIKTAFVLVVPPTLAVVIASMCVGGGVLAMLRRYWRMPIWMLVGSVIGTRLFIVIDPAPLTLLLAVGILVYLGMDRLGRGQSPAIQARSHTFGAAFGTAAGVLEGAVNIAAPPLLIYFLALGLAPVALVQALNLCFFTGKTTQLSTLVLTAGVAPAVWWSTLPLCAIGVATLLAGMRVRERVDAATYRRWLKLALFGMALILAAQFLFRNASSG